MGDANTDCMYRPPIQFVQNVCPKKSPYCLVRKLVNLMDNPMSAKDVSRHLVLLQEFLQVSYYAFVSFYI